MTREIVHGLHNKGHTENPSIIARYIDIHLFKKKLVGATTVCLQGTRIKTIIDFYNFILYTHTIRCRNVTPSYYPR